MGDGSNNAGNYTLEDGSGSILMEDGSFLRLDDDVYGPVVRADSPLAYWRCGEASGNLVDVIGGRVLVAAGSHTYGVRSGIFDTNTAVSVGSLAHSAGDYFSMTADATLELNDGPRSYEFWYAAGESALGIAILNYSSQGTIEANAAELRFTAGGNSIVSVAENFIDRGWFHIVVSRTAAGAGGTKLYRNAIDVTVEGVSIADTLSASPSLVIADTGASIPLFYIDEIALYNTVLSQARVLAHYNAGVENHLKLPVPPSIAAH